MAGIYIHIPFCKQACHYCNFHFTTSIRRKNEFVDALLKEINLRREYLSDEIVETIYFGGGTPSLLDEEELSAIMRELNNEFSITTDAEITLEANPDDISEDALYNWLNAGINRLSIGIQSFYEEDLRWMNRAHSATQAANCINLARKAGFSNFSIDLIYGTSTLSDERWEQNVRIAMELKIPHLSCYALTVEPKTPLHKLIETHRVEDVDAERQASQFIMLMNLAASFGYEHYEISNFALPGFRSRHNSSYWQGKPYLGLGPSAHSYNGSSRQWNVSNNNIYIRNMATGQPVFEKEELTHTQQLNEYIMTALRTREGIDMERVQTNWGLETAEKLKKEAKRFLTNGDMIANDKALQLTNEGKLRADGISSALFF